MDLFSSVSIKEITKALILAQAEMRIAVKESFNPYLRNKYADLNSVREACIPTLNKYKISVLQPITFIDGKSFVQTILLHESAEWLGSLTEIVCNKPNDAQSFGSGITYARRYGLQSFLNIGCEDDDGNLASGREITAEIIEEIRKKANECKTVAELQKYFRYLPPEQQNHEKIMQIFIKLRKEKDQNTLNNDRD